jgi:hypothetical protein
VILGFPVYASSFSKVVLCKGLWKYHFGKAICTKTYLHFEVASLNVWCGLVVLSADPQVKLAPVKASKQNRKSAQVHQTNLL